ncbi:MAG: PaaI family thioesterase [Marinifilaceae bacterium]|jgi:acyl-coenzyme A thioesterase PaaI-like protein|nr:PaaI family thioesterase [Marinifilaceae bacterium]
MRKIHNPYNNGESGNCFGCSQKNEHGLQMEFYEDEEFIISNWTPKKHITGFKDVIHGGIQACILDEIASWVVFIKCKTGGVTSSLQTNYLSPVYASKGDLHIKAKLIEIEGRNAKIWAAIYDANGKECTNAEVNYSIFPEKVASRKFQYPGLEAFFKED